MPTDKRERQRAGRETRRAAAHAAQKRAVRRRQIITLLIGAAVIVAIALAINLSGDDSKDADSVAAKDTATAADAAEPAPCPPATPEGTDSRRFAFSKAPEDCLDPTASYTAEVETDKGKFTIALDAAKAPATVNAFVFLSRYHAYDGVDFHRVIPGFVVQGGDVEKKGGTGGPGYTLPDELPQAGEYKVGSVAMANTSQPNTGGSQFFVITGDQGVALPPQYSLFGTVIDGLDVVKAIEADGSAQGTPTVTHKIVKVTIIEKKG
jgi:cyclophilin family peptidyl-prolyl cis-trans isomerase